MIEKINRPHYERLSLPNAAYLVAVSRCAQSALRAPLVIAELGVGIGASALAASKALREEDSYYLFDYQEKVAELIDDLEGTLDPHPRYTACGATRCERDSYVWNLADLLVRRTADDEAAFDVVLLDGAHDLTIDLAACAIVVELIKPGGYLVVDNPRFKYDDVAAKGPDHFARVSKLYSARQRRTAQIELVDRAFLSNHRLLQRIPSPSDCDSITYRKRNPTCS